MTKNDAISLQGVKKDFGNFTAISSVSFDIADNEFFTLLGPSGCGKTTLLRLIAGFEQPSNGVISYKNKIISSPSFVLPPEKRGIGMVFQDYALFPHLDVWGNVSFGIKHSNDIRRAQWLLDLLGLNGLNHRFPHELSGGQRQRLGLARALAPGTSLVLLDEPFSSLDVEVRHNLRNELPRILHSCSASAVLVTHDPQEALAICDRVAIMCDGEIHQFSSPNELVNIIPFFFGTNCVQSSILFGTYLVNVLHLLVPISCLGYEI